MALGNAVIPPSIIRGEDRTLNLQLLNKDGSFLDLTTATEIDCLFLNTDGTCLHKKLSLSEVIVVSALAGKFQILLLIADTVLLSLSNPDADAPYNDIEVRLTIGGKKTIVLLKQVIKVVERLFPAC